MFIYVKHRKPPCAVSADYLNFSWKTETDELSGLQTGYRIKVDVIKPNRRQYWDSGYVESSDSQFIPYGGDILPGGALFKVTLEVRDSRKKISYAEANFISSFSSHDLNGVWIGSEDTAFGWLSEERRLPARYCRFEFQLDTLPDYCPGAFCGLGWYELFINGEPISPDKFSPALSDYDKRVYYQMYDISPFLRKGSNEILAIVGNGRYFSPRLNTPFRTKTYGLPSFFCMIRLSISGGDYSVITTDNSWQVTTEGPIRENNEYDGELYDARYEKNLQKDSSSWKPAATMPSPGGKLNIQETPPIRIIDTILPISVRRMEEGRLIFDMGQNMVGFCRIQIKGKRGDKIVLRFAERLDDNGELYTENLRSAKATDTYILRGGMLESWQPQFTFHGFRYVELSDISVDCELTEHPVTGCVVHDDLEKTGNFSCSIEQLNTIYRNIRWGIRGNYRSIPTDCPQRDERHGWLGDRCFSSRGETWYYNIYPLYVKWLEDMVEGQNSNGLFPSTAPSFWDIRPLEITWSGSFIAILQMLVSTYGDKTLLQRFYEPSIKYLLFMYSLVGNDGLLHHDHYGDWCIPPEQPELIHSLDPSRATPSVLLASSYLYHLTCLVTQWAKLNNDMMRMRVFTQKAVALKNAFNTVLFHPEKGYYGNGSVTSQILPLAFGLTETEMIPSIKRYIRKKIQQEHHNHVASGLVGMQHFFRTLAKIGLEDIALKTVRNTEFPGFGYMVSKGATTIWELWNGDTADPAMNSGNHVMLIGDLHIWIHENLGGIRIAKPESREVIFSPHVLQGFSWVSCRHETTFGLLESIWKLDGNVFTWEITVPFNASAKITIPGTSCFRIKRNPNDSFSPCSKELIEGHGSYIIESALD